MYIGTSHVWCCFKPLVEPRVTATHGYMYSRQERLVAYFEICIMLSPFDKPRQVAREVVTDCFSTRMAGLLSSKLGLQPR
jgi:hypothetical protein